MGGRLDRREGNTFLIRLGLIMLVVAMVVAMTNRVLMLVLMRRTWPSSSPSSRMTRDNALHLHMHPRSFALPNNQHILDRCIGPSHSSSGGLVKDRLQDPSSGIDEPVTDLVHGQLCRL